ncbi:HEPN domain-containing protein [Caulobacter sp. RL271]|jgi:predicted nucleotidyltransferase/HEPN domain-containing protein|uniref:HEPN domain-containing protein n=1 Tax=Caulobacter segnis TaxID=88688 RepID=A0ABY4ZNM6_9CAUL|nr:HEPN domain-containing protein [Caulobacter segnis]USQ94183.1 HEPN domain-containing protein [Caulobacter segnis]
MAKPEHHRAARAEEALATRRAAGETAGMGNTIDHLPAGKQRELAFVVEVLKEAFAAEVAKRSGALGQGKILKIILFGSYARGDWVEDPVGRYFSDYDLLVVVDQEKLSDPLEFWEAAEKRLLDELSAGQRLRTPVNFIVHDLEDVNEQLRLGRYFFTDIVRDGVVLFEVHGHPLIEPTPLSAEQALEESHAYYEEWMESADQFLEHARIDVQKGWPKPAAFHLHQTTERLYYCLLLVVTLYAPKSHNLVRLRGLAEPLDPRLAEIWPTETKFHKRCFELLRAAYVKARYSPHYKVTTEELAWIQARIELLQSLVKELCEARLKALQDAASIGHR